MDNTEYIVGIVERLLPALNDPPDPLVRARNPSAYEIRRAHRVQVGSELLRELVLGLEDDDTINSFKGGYYYPFPGCQSGPLNLESIAHWILAQARIHPIRDCVACLRELLHENSSKVFEIFPVWGIAPKKAIALNSDLHVTPIADIPISRYKDALTGDSAESQEFGKFIPRPGAALIREHLDGPMYIRGGEAPRPRLSLPSVSEQRRQRSMGFGGELAPVVGLLSGFPVLCVSHWSQRPSHLPLVGQQVSWSGAQIEESMCSPITKHVLDEAALVPLVNCYLSLDEATKDYLQIPLGKLNTSRWKLLHNELESSAVELGVALESLLVDDQGPPGTITKRFVSRGADLLDGENRAGDETLLRQVYDLRSRSAHSGSVEGRSHATSKSELNARRDKARSLILAGHKAAIAMLKRVIATGSTPQWRN